MPDPFAPWRTSLALWQLGWQAQAVIALRTLAMLGVLPRRAGEDRRMVEEKVRAFGLSALAAGAAAAKGGDAHAVARAAIRPLAKRTRSNVRRLTRPPKPKPKA